MGNKTVVSVRLPKDQKEMLESKITSRGFESVSGFFRFLAVNFIHDRLDVDLKDKPEKLSAQKRAEYEAELDQLEKVVGFIPIEDLKSKKKKRKKKL